MTFRMSALYLMHTKDEVFGHWKDYVARTERTFNKKIRVLRSDGGGEYNNRRMLEFLRTSGIKWERSIPHTPQQNGTSERLNQTLMNRARAMMTKSELPSMFWSEAVKAVCHLKNRTPCKGDDGLKTPWERAFGVKPDVSHVRVWGCDAFLRKAGCKRKKIGDKADAVKLVGYGEEDGVKGYRFWHPKSKTVIFGRDATFQELVKCPGEHEVITIDDDDDEDVKVVPPTKVKLEPKGDHEPEVTVLDSTVEDVKTDEESGGLNTDDALDIFVDTADEDGLLTDSELFESMERRARLAVEAQRNNSTAQDHQSNDDQGEARGLRALSFLPNSQANSNDARAGRTGSTSSVSSNSRFEEEVANLPNKRASAMRQEGATKSMLRTPIDRATPSQEEPPSANLVTDDLAIPRNAEEAMKNPLWRQAMEDEMDSFAAIGAWDLVVLPSGAKTVGCRWVFTTKTDGDGKFVKCKARLVAQGFTQTPGVDFDETFSPVARHSSIRIY